MRFAIAANNLDAAGALLRSAPRHAVPPISSSNKQRPSPANTYPDAGVLCGLPLYIYRLSAAVGDSEEAGLDRHS